MYIPQTCHSLAPFVSVRRRTCLFTLTFALCGLALCGLALALVSPMPVLASEVASGTGLDMAPEEGQPDDDVPSTWTLHSHLFANWGWAGADLAENPVQRAFLDDPITESGTWKFGYVTAQLRLVNSRGFSCTVQGKYQQRGDDLYVEQLRDDVELDLGFCAYQRDDAAGNSYRLAVGDQHFSFGLHPADVPLVDIFPERAAVVYGESIRRRADGGMVQFSFAPLLDRHSLELVAYYVYDYLLGFGVQTQSGSELDEISTEAYGVQAVWTGDSGLTLALGAREVVEQDTEDLLQGVPEQAEVIFSVEQVTGPWTATWETVFTDSLTYNALPGQLDEERVASYLEVSHSAGRWAIASRASYAWASQETPTRTDPRLAPYPALLPFLPFSYDPVRWELGLAVRYALRDSLHFKASVTTGEYGYLSDVAFTDSGALALFRDAGQDTQYSFTVGVGLDRMWEWPQ